MTEVHSTIEIAGRKIGACHSPYIICEMSANHNGSLEKALEMIDVAVETGCDAIKLQTYTADTLTVNSSDEAFRIKGGLWDQRTLYDLYQEAHTPWGWHEIMFERARLRGVTMFSSPFDTTAVDFLMDLNAPAFKIASFEVIDLPLIRYVASTGKPMIISTGMADDDEIEEAAQAAREGGCNDFALLHCVSGYPAPASDYNLATIPDMAKRWGVPIGLSDHTLENSTAIASVALGASVIEKHFTLDRSGGGPDDSFSLEPAEFAALCTDARTAWEAVGHIDYGRKSSELGNITFRRSLYFVKDLAEGDIVTSDSIRSIRPGYGLPPKYADALVGMRVSRNVQANTPTRWEVFENSLAT